MELCWIFLLVFFRCISANVNRPEPEPNPKACDLQCIVVNIPHIVCAPDISKVTITPCHEFMTVSNQKDLHFKGSNGPAYQGSPGTERGRETNKKEIVKSTKDQVPPQQGNQKSVETANPHPSPLRESKINQPQEKVNQNNPGKAYLLPNQDLSFPDEKKDPKNNFEETSNQSQMKDTGDTVEYILCRLPPKNSPLSPCPTKAPNSAPVKHPQPCAIPQKRPPIFIEPLEPQKKALPSECLIPFLQNSPTSRVVNQDYGYGIICPVSDNPGYIYEMSTLHNVKPNDGRIDPYDDYSSRNLGGLEETDYKYQTHPRAWQLNDKNCHIPVGKSHWLIGSGDQALTTASTLSDRDYIYKLLNSYPTKSEPNPYCDNYFLQSNTPIQRQLPNRSFVLGQNSPINPEQNLHLFNSYPGLSQPCDPYLNDKYRVRTDHNLGQNGKNYTADPQCTCPSQSKSPVKNSPDKDHHYTKHTHDQNQNSFQPSECVYPGQNYSTKAHPNPDQQPGDHPPPPTYSAVNILSCDKEIRPPEPRPDYSVYDVNFVKNPDAEPEVPFDIDYTRKEYTDQLENRNSGNENTDAQTMAGDQYQ